MKFNEINKKTLVISALRLEKRGSSKSFIDLLDSN